MSNLKKALFISSAFIVLSGTILYASSDDLTGIFGKPGDSWLGKARGSFLSKGADWGGNIGESFTDSYNKAAKETRSKATSELGKRQFGLGEPITLGSRRFPAPGPFGHMTSDELREYRDSLKSRTKEEMRDLGRKKGAVAGDAAFAGVVTGTVAAVGSGLVGLAKWVFGGDSQERVVYVPAPEEPENIRDAKTFIRRCPDLSDEEIAKKCGLSVSEVRALRS